jgi:hypothetical protein
MTDGKEYFGGGDVGSTFLVSRIAVLGDRKPTGGSFASFHSSLGFARRTEGQRKPIPCLRSISCHRAVSNRPADGADACGRQMKPVSASPQKSAIRHPTAVLRNATRDSSG